MKTELQIHLEQGRDALIKRTMDGSIREVPLEQVEKVLNILVKNDILTLRARAGVLFADERIISQAGKKVSA